METAVSVVSQHACNVLNYSAHMFVSLWISPRYVIHLHIAGCHGSEVSDFRSVICDSVFVVEYWFCKGNALPPSESQCNWGADVARSYRQDDAKCGYSDLVEGATKQRSFVLSFYITWLCRWKTIVSQFHVINGAHSAFPPICLFFGFRLPCSSTAATITWPYPHLYYLYLYSNFIFGGGSGVDDVNCAESVLTRPAVQNVLPVWYTLVLLDDSLPLVEHNILLDQEPKMEVACCSETLVDCVWNVMAHGDTREEEWRGNKRMEWVTSKRYMTAEHRLAQTVQTLQADVRSLPASSRLNWRPCRFKWTRPFCRKTKSSFCACGITFQTQSTYLHAARLRSQ
jgi:hypothetical protein